MIAALFVAADGCYFGLPNVDPWDITRDARKYAGPHKIIAHPPCERWGRYYHGSPRKPFQYRLGDDGGCFHHTLVSLRNHAGIAEHPKDSRARKWFNLTPPPANGGWVKADDWGGWTCCVEQGHYGHIARKPTWLLSYGTERPDLIWGPSEQRLPAYAVERYGYAKARRIGVMAAIGGKDKTMIRNATPLPFRDLLIGIVAGRAAASEAT